MERKEFLNHGLVRLPPGFRFHPTDEELVVQYLRRKAFSFPLPANIIPEIDLAKLNLLDLPCGFGEEKYFFNLRESKRCKKNGRVACQETRLGYWKPVGKEKPVSASSQGKELVGLKQVMAFYKGKSPNGSKTDWAMHQYSLSNNELVLKSSTQSLIASSKEWVVCRIFVKRRGMKLRASNTRLVGENTQIPATCSSSSSSCVTDDDDDLAEEQQSNKGEEAMSKFLAV